MGSKILIIDDDSTMLELLQTLLDMEGFEVNVLEANYSSENIAVIIKETQPVLVLCDVFLKDTNGLDLLKSIRSAPELNQVRVLMSSGIDYSHECFNEKADGFILKPYMPEDLIKKINDILSAMPNPS